MGQYFIQVQVVLLLSNTAYSLYQSQEGVGRAGRTFTVPFKWEEASSQGFCGHAHYITDVDTVNTLVGISLEETLTPAQWLFKSPATADVAIAVYIPTDDYRSGVIAIVPPLTIRREVVYRVYIKSLASAGSDTRECLSRTIDQSEYQSVFVELGSCRVTEADTIYISLSYRNISGSEGARE